MNYLVYTRHLSDSTFEQEIDCDDVLQAVGYARSLLQREAMDVVIVTSADQYGLAGVMTFTGVVCSYLMDDAKKLMHKLNHGEEA